MTMMRYQTPMPLKDERPVMYAGRVGQWYATLISETHKKTLGQYLTPVEIATFMAKLFELKSNNQMRILDPGAGAGILSCALCESLLESPRRPENIHLEAFEIDAELASQLETCLSYTKSWLQSQGVSLEFVIYTDDFVTHYAEALDNTPRLFPQLSTWEPFDVAISNPPYFKISKSDPRAQVASSVVHGQPNIYAIFMAISASLLRAGGELIFITPRSYTAGPYFRLFREKFFAQMRPKAIHLFDSRRDAFDKDDVLQENVILLAQKRDNWSRRPTQYYVKVSHSAGTRDLSMPDKRNVDLADILDLSSNDKVLRIPITEKDDLVTHIVQSWLGNLHAYGLEISTGPVVPFRASSLTAKTGQLPKTHAPLIWMQNVMPMQVTWPAKNNKDQYIVVNPASMSLLLADKNYVLLRRFSSKEQKRRLTAAPLLRGSLNSPLIGLENHLNYIYRPKGTLSEEEAYGLAALLNSNLLDSYFRIYNGNTQVSATELRAMPLPDLKKIIEIGKHAMRLSEPTFDALDALVEDVLNVTPKILSTERTFG